MALYSLKCADVLLWNCIGIWIPRGPRPRAQALM